MQPLPLTSPPAEALVRSFLLPESATDDTAVRRICGCRFSGNMTVLAFTSLLFLSITVAQTFGAILANSSAMLADCVAGYVDSGTSFANMLAESRRGTRCHRWSQLTIPAISLSLLIYFTLDVMREAFVKLSPEGDADDEGVNPYIVIAFAVWGLVFDSASVAAFIINSKQSGQEAEINMLAVFVHVAADLARSTSILVESILLFTFDWNEAVVDAWTCIVVSVCILMAAAYAIYEWGTEVADFIRTGE